MSGVNPFVDDAESAARVECLERAYRTARREGQEQRDLFAWRLKRNRRGTGLAGWFYRMTTYSEETMLRYSQEETPGERYFREELERASCHSSTTNHR